MKARPTQLERRISDGIDQHRDSVRRATGRESRNSAVAIGLLLFALLPGAGAQEVPRPSVTRQKVKQALPTAGNLRVGPVLLRLDAAFTTEFLDNVNLTPSKVADIILAPSLGITAIWPMSRQNTLRFRTSVGYLKYVNSSELDRPNLVISPDSVLNFDIYSGDFRINFHEQFSIQQETVSQGTLSGVAQLGRFTNTIGASVLWDMNDVIWTIGYDNFLFLTIGDATNSQGTLPQNVSQLDHTTDQISTSVSLKLSSVAIGGLEVVGSSSTYPDSSRSDYSSLTVGPFIEYQLTDYTHLFLSGGYKLYSGSGATQTAILGATTSSQDGTQSGFYASAGLIHTLNRYYKDRLDFGHSDEVDAFNGRAKTQFVRYSASWEFNRKLTLGLGLFYENVDQITGNPLNASIPEKFWRVGGTLSTGYRLTEHVDLSLAYRYTKKDSNVPQFSYSQNSVTISLGYRF